MPTSVLHLIDSLAVGGAERVAVNLANHLPRNRYTVTLCTSRRGGPLANELASHVAWLNLGRRSTGDLSAVYTLARELLRRNTRLLHAHSTSLFLARAAAMFAPAVKIIWHDHFGLCETISRPVWTYRTGVLHIGGVIAVNTVLANWAVDALRVPSQRVWCVRNMAYLPPRSARAVDLPGTPGSRIVCLANFRPQKDHPILIAAMARVAANRPDAHLLLVGSGQADYVAYIRTLVGRHGLANRITFLGERNDVSDILAGCDIGVLASVSEGLPLSLLEYGAAGLATVATSVGECPDVLDGGNAGILVPPSTPSPLADALLILLNTPELRRNYANRLRARIHSQFSPEPVIESICRIYDIVSGCSSPVGMKTPERILP